MKVIKPSATIISPGNGDELVKHIEKCGRVCYKSEQGDTKNFIHKILKRGHESVLEHASVTVHFVVDRGVSHELVRHRIASFSQESTRYCNYSKDKFGNELTFIEPCFFNPDECEYDDWIRSCKYAEMTYNDMTIMGKRKPQEARSILPNSLKTEVMMTANFREWRHFFMLRADIAAHPQMREVAIPLLKEFKKNYPYVFDDIIIGENGSTRKYLECEGDI